MKEYHNIPKENHKNTPNKKFSKKKLPFYVKGNIIVSELKNYVFRELTALPS